MVETVIRLPVRALDNQSKDRGHTTNNLNLEHAAPNPAVIPRVGISGSMAMRRYSP